jgi:hypothetical protein
MQLSAARVLSGKPAVYEDDFDVGVFDEGIDS